MIKDYQNKSGRLNKRKDTANFNLADNDDFYGYSKEEGDLTIAQTIGVLFIGLPALFLLLSILLALTPNI